MRFKHYLNFIDLPQIGTIEIGEPIGFDSSSYKVKRDKKRFGRDLIIANEETDLTFTRSYFEQMEVTQMLPNGEIISYASQGFDFLLDVFQNEGWESQIEYILQKDGIDFVTGIFSYFTAVVEFDQIKVKIVQNTNREIIKRLEDTDIDAFNSVALDDREITPCSTTNILLKAKPTTQNSVWEQLEPKLIEAIGVVDPFNLARQITKYEIRNTLTSFSESAPSFNGAMDNFRFINAQNDLTNGILKVDANIVFHYQQSGGSSASTAGFRLRYGLWVGDNFDISQEFGTLYSKFLTGTATQDFILNEVLEIPLNNIPRGFNLSLFWEVLYTSEHLELTTFNFIKSNIDIIYTSTAIDTVVKGVRLIDLMKHNVKSIADTELSAPIYESGGEHYNNFAFNGLLLGQITDKPFYNKFKDLMTIPNEVCADYQINENNVEILPYNEFYNDVEMAVFEQLSDYESQTKMNPIYAMKTANYKYKKSSEGRETNGENSIDDVHTETQKYLSNMVDGEFKVDLNHIRSAYLIEEARQRAFDLEQSKALENDDSLFLLDCIELAPSTKGGFGAVLLMRITETGHLQILNNNLNGDGINFNWNLLGFAVGGTFFIDSGENVGTWQALSITDSVLELFPISVTASFEGDAYITMSWFFNDVSFTNRTNEGFTLIEGVDNPSKYSNLNYHWSRNIQRWYPYLATATKFKPNGAIKTTSFKTNGNLVTRKIGEIENVSDSAEINNIDIAQYKILNPFTHSIKVYADFEKVTQLIKDIAGVKGYVSVRLNDGRNVKGFINEMDYDWSKEELQLEIEEKFISDYMEITPSGITLTGYDEKSYLESFQINNNFVLLFDANSLQLFPPIRFALIKINGILFTDLTAFTDALIDFMNE
jgi:hypothetical protein